MFVKLNAISLHYSYRGSNKKSLKPLVYQRSNNRGNCLPNIKKKVGPKNHEQAPTATNFENLRHAKILDTNNTTTTGVSEPAVDLCRKKRDIPDIPSGNLT